MGKIVNNPVSYQISHSSKVEYDIQAVLWAYNNFLLSHTWDHSYQLVKLSDLLIINMIETAVNFH